MFLPSVVEDRENSTCFVSGGQRGAAYLWDLGGGWGGGWGGGVVQRQRNRTTSTASDLGIFFLGGGGDFEIHLYFCLRKTNIILH